MQLLKSSIEDSNQSLSKDNLYSTIETDPSKLKSSSQLREKQLLPLIESDNLTKMISADSYLPHSATASSGALPPPPPTYSRLPPDGHEFPPDYRDPSSNITSMFQVSKLVFILQCVCTNVILTMFRINLNI